VGRKNVYITPWWAVMLPTLRTTREKTYFEIFSEDVGHDIKERRRQAAQKVVAILTASSRQPHTKVVNHK
jgi:hypothetical protein